MEPQNNNLKELTLILNSGGLNQFYLNPNTIIPEYNQLQTFFYSKLSFLSIDKQEIDAIIKNALTTNGNKPVINILPIIEKKLSQYINIKKKESYDIQNGIEVNIRKLLSLSENQTNMLVHINQLAENYNIIVKVPNQICLFIESIILTELHFPSSIKIINNEQDEELSKVISQMPKNYFIFDFDLERLFHYHSMGTWTAYITNYIKIQCKNDLVSSYNTLNINNLNIIRTKGIFFNFSVFFVIQMLNYCSIIQQISKTLPSNKSNDFALKQAIKELKPINCLIIYRYLFKSGEIKRAHLFICNSKVNYIAYIGSTGQSSYDDLLDLSINYKGKIDCFLGKFSEVQELQYFDKMIKSIEAYCDKNKDLYCINSLKHLDKFLIREKMIVLMQDYCKLDSIAKLPNETIAFPLSYSEQLTSVNTYEDITSYMKKKNLSLPLILKFTGPKLEYNHLLINIITEEGLKNYIAFIHSFTQGDKDKISVVMQSYVNHGGYVIKLYRINHKSYIFYRPSLPDAREDLVSIHEEYKRGFYQTFTSALVTKEFREFWNKVSHNIQVNKNVNEDYLNSLADIFEQYTDNNLIGLDFLYDYENKVYYLIDVNCFPGYKELIEEFNDLISNHVEYYYNRFKSKINQ